MSTPTLTSTYAVRKPPAPPPPRQTVLASREGLADRSVLDGTASLKASRLHTSLFGTAIGLGISAVIDENGLCALDAVGGRRSAIGGRRSAVGGRPAD